MSIINQINVGGTTYLIKGSSQTSIFYGTSTSDNSATTKEVTCSEFTSTDLVSGVMIIVVYNKSNTAAVTNLQMNVNNTGAKPVKRRILGNVGNLLDPLEFYGTMLFMYNGLYWILLSTTYDSDYKVQQNAAITTAGNYPVILATSTSTTLQTNSVNKTALFTYNPSTKLLQTGALGVTTGVGYTTVVPTTTTGYTDGQVMFVVFEDD